MSRSCSRGFGGIAANGSISVPPRSTNKTLRMATSLRARDGFEQQIVVFRPADRDSHAILEQRIVERPNEDAGAPRRVAKGWPVARLDHDELGIARVDVDDLRHVAQRGREAGALALQQR